MSKDTSSNFEDFWDDALAVVANLRKAGINDLTLRPDTDDGTPVVITSFNGRVVTVLRRSSGWWAITDAVNNPFDMQAFGVHPRNLSRSIYKSHWEATA